MARIRKWAEHRWVYRRLSDYLDGDLTSRARRRLRAHAHDCPACGPTLCSLKRVVQGLRSLPSMDDPSIAPSVISRLRTEPVDIRSRGRRIAGPRA
jgi:anti-sigma factor RsiW